jgi:hypothetical protein
MLRGLLLILVAGFFGSLLSSLQTLPPAFARAITVAPVDSTAPCAVAVDELPVAARYRFKGMLENNDLDLILSPVKHPTALLAAALLEADSHCEFSAPPALSLLSCRLLI